MVDGSRDYYSGGMPDSASRHLAYLRSDNFLLPRPSGHETFAIVLSLRTCPDGSIIGIHRFHPVGTSPRPPAVLGSAPRCALQLSRWAILAFAFCLSPCVAGCSSKGTNSPVVAVESRAAPTATVALASLPLDGGRTEALVKGVAALHGQVETRVDLSFTAVTDDDLARLEFPETVREINLSSTKITDRGIEHLMRIPYLESLVLMDTQVTAGVVEILKRMPSLCEVRLDNTNVPIPAQLELISYLAPRASARAQRQTAAAAARPR